MPSSKRIKADIAKASWIRRMFEEGLALKRKVGEANVFDFSLGNPFLEPPAEFFEALDDVANDGTPGRHQYMPNAGLPEVRQVYADRHRLESGLDYEAQHIVMTVGAAGAINVTLKTLLDPGDEVVLLAPYFAEYWFYVENHGGVPIVVNTNATFDPDPEAIAAAITPRTRAVLINSPNNPSGRVYSHSVIASLAEALRERQKQIGSAIYLITDEPYRSLVYDGVEVPYVETYYDNTIVCSSHSKDLGLPGERIGHLAVSPHAADAKEVLDGMSFALRTLGFVNAPALMQRVVARVLDASVDVNFYRRNRDTLYQELKSLGFELTRPQGAFYLFPKSPLDDDEKFIRHLQKHRILTVPGKGFGTPGYFRVSYAVPRDVLERSLPVWKQAAREIGLKAALA